jgi:hypothetical protein
MPSGLETALFARLIDHAPLFPPASLPLDEALQEHRRARESEDGWIVRRFVAPASALPALNGEPLRLSLVLDDDHADVDDPRVESVEIPPRPGTEFRFLRVFSVESYVEVEPRTILLFAEAMGRDGAQLKLRCGPTAPPLDELAAAIHACREHGIPFKATAGLHHAVRQDGQHGFLNLLAASIFGDEDAALAEEDADAFRIERDAFRWRDRAASTLEVERGRELFVAFGSCSFAEPVDDLRALGLLAP